MNANRQTAGYQLPVYDAFRPRDLEGRARRHYPIVIVGGGLTGLTAACDFAVRGIEAIVLDDDDTVGVRGASSRGMVYVQKSLEVFDRLGIYERLAAKGISWSVGRTLAGNDIIYEFDASGSTPSIQPPFVNIQQFYVEWYLVDRICELGLTELRWKNKVVGVRPQADYIELDVETPFGNYAIEADWVIDASGANSLVRESLRLDTHPDLAKDQWCICDVRFSKRLPKERWTWVSAPFNGGRAVWQHPMPDDVWRLDYQMGDTASPEEAGRSEVAAARVREHLGAGTEFEMVWIGPWFYRTHLLDQFRHGRLFFIGDAAHVVSPFGARGGNSGIADADNLVWKMAMVMRGLAGPSLLDSYNEERRFAAQENVKVTRRTSRFLAPATPQERMLRDATVALAREFPFARRLVNTGRLAIANSYAGLARCHGGGLPVANLRLETPSGAKTLVDLVRANGDRLIALVRSDREREFAAVSDFQRALPVQSIAVHNWKTPALPDVKPEGLALIRPDLYLAGTLDYPAPAALRALVERTLH